MWLCAARIDHYLACAGGKVSRLIAQNTVVGGNLVLHPDKGTGDVTIDLTNTSTVALADDEASWPKVGNLVLDGFTYGRIIEGPTDAAKRLEWLARQREFRPQPYKQLARVLRERGDEQGAKRVLYEMERRRHEGKATSWFERMWTRF